MIWTLLWVGWLLLFLAIEIPADVNRRTGDTLSEHMWRWLGIGRARVGGWAYLRRFVFVCFAAWLVIHTFSGGWL